MDTVALASNIPLALQDAAQELRAKQVQALHALGANALCPAPKRFPSGKLVYVKSEFGFMPRVKV